ncbi:alanine--tRNA ligase [Carboxylicivirga linearis]|uniref:Alanine--tRNA ligase n=2 Tax=Carboxylicivirga linearis TaxID=1628157 RepID=A0ABS5JST6_9BACT|nr:alanine--tRNA ligase [Carboxylicivirga linearis]
MTASEIRKSYWEFFRSKQHKIVPSAPMVVKNDPTLMFTNAGMNQFKDIFLGNNNPVAPRVANSQKCLRVSGKHNDLEEVGHDTYHHTMFEMLGNWSFGDYFKKEVIDWAWEYLTEVLKIDKDRLYVTVFEGNKEDNVDRDNEAADNWKKWIAEDRIINGNKKDNFWEMGDTGPCGPCSEIHIDMRPDEERAKVDGKSLVNQDHPQVIEIWNLVFIQFNRKANGELVPLPKKHVDTGMGFERLCRALQGKTSNYDTDIFQPILNKIAELTGFSYGNTEEVDIAMRVVADHVRTIAFSITDGQLPSNNKAGYVIRRILRRAVRYSYTFLNAKEAFMYQLIDALIETMGDAYPELEAQKTLVGKVIKEEEESFLRTLSTGISMLDKIIADTKSKNFNVVHGAVAFELYDTFGFPLDLTELILKENDLVVNREEFQAEMEKQKQRARNATAIETDDWQILQQDDREEFIGYDYLETEIFITRYRKIKAKNKELYQLVFNITPFYAESGGQVGDTGYIQQGDEKISIIDTKKENNLIVHLTKKLPQNLNGNFKAVVNTVSRQNTANNHTATHLLHHALREVLGDHVEQKGSLVHPEYLRFDFAHFQKLTNEELDKVSSIVNSKIRQNIGLEENREIPYPKALEMGAMALFGEKYGDLVRTIKFNDSVELCGGTHVQATGEIGIFRIISESSIAAGIRRIEAVTGPKAEEFINQQFGLIKELQNMFKNPANLKKNIEHLMEENIMMSKEVQGMKKSALTIEKRNIMDSAKDLNGISLMACRVKPVIADQLKDLAHSINNETDQDIALVLGGEVNGKPQLAILFSEKIIKEFDLNAGNIVREAAKRMQGGGGGQPFFATAGGKNLDGLDTAIEEAVAIIKSKIEA